MCTSVLFTPLLRPYLVEFLDLSDDLVVEGDDILAAYVCGAILLEER